MFTEASEQGVILVYAAQFIKDRLYFATIKKNSLGSRNPRSTLNTHYFSIDDELVYEKFYDDFGPLNLSMLYKYCDKLNKKLEATHLLHKKIVHYTTTKELVLPNAAFLMASYSILYLKFTPEKAFQTIQKQHKCEMVPFRDASYGPSLFRLTLKHCLDAVAKANTLGFFNFKDFDSSEYDYYEKVAYGDLNWILPGKFLAFCGPHSENKLKNGYTHHTPETYFNYFRANNVTNIIRLNTKQYSASRFNDAGFKHHDLYFTDGSFPSDEIAAKFIQICEKAEGAIAVHCKAGLGRTGVLIACYLIKHYDFTAAEAIAWLRICRPGSVIGTQQPWLIGVELELRKEGTICRSNLNKHAIQKFTHGIYSIKAKANQNKNLSNSFKLKKTTKGSDADDGKEDRTVDIMMSRVNTLKLDDQTDGRLSRSRDVQNRNIIEDLKNRNTSVDETAVINGMSQGDRLSKLKFDRAVQMALFTRLRDDPGQQKVKSVSSLDRRLLSNAKSNKSKDKKSHFDSDEEKKRLDYGVSSSSSNGDGSKSTSAKSSNINGNKINEKSATKAKMIADLKVTAGPSGGKKGALESRILSCLRSPVKDNRRPLRSTNNNNNTTTNDSCQRRILVRGRISAPAETKTNSVPNDRKTNLDNAAVSFRQEDSRRLLRSSNLNANKRHVWLSGSVSQPAINVETSSLKLDEDKPCVQSRSTKTSLSSRRTTRFKTTGSLCSLSDAESSSSRSQILTVNSEAAMANPSAVQSGSFKRRTRLKKSCSTPCYSRSNNNPLGTEDDVISSNSNTNSTFTHGPKAVTFRTLYTKSVLSSRSQLA